MGSVIYIDTEGPNPGGVAVGFCWLFKQSEASGQPGLVVVHVLQNLHNMHPWVEPRPTAPVLLDRLRKDRVVQQSNAELRLMTIRTQPSRHDGPALVFHPSLKLLQYVERIPGVTDMFVVPWGLDEIAGWLHQRQAIRLPADPA